MPPPAPAPAKAPTFVFWTLNALLAAAFLAELAVPNLSPALDAATLTLAAVASIAALHRQLPLQNVLLAAAIAALFGSVAHGLSANPDIGIPFGPVVFNPACGAKMFHLLPWPVPLLWIVAIFNARGTARLILRPWRKVKNYGYWLIGLTALLAVAFDFALEPYAWHVKHFWLWAHTKIPVTWQGATLLNFVGWVFVALLILMFGTPSLIRKQPGSRGTPDWQPFAIWFGAVALFAVGCAEAGLWLAAGVDAAIALVTTVFAVRGARW